MDDPVIGSAGRKYGLHVPQRRVEVVDDDSEIRAAEAMRKRAMREAELQQAKILEEDPTAFDYDAVYEAVHSSVPQERKAVSRRSRYLESMMKKAEERKREHDVYFERKLQREIEQDQEQFGDKEKFVTAAYKKKLQEDQRWAAEQAKRDAENEDVRKKEDMSGFHSLLRDIAFDRNRGPGKEPPAPSAPAPTPASASAPASSTGSAAATQAQPPSAAPSASVPSRDRPAERARDELDRRDSRVRDRDADRRDDRRRSRSRSRSRDRGRERRDRDYRRRSRSRSRSRSPVRPRSTAEKAQPVGGAAPAVAAAPALAPAAAPTAAPPVVDAETERKRQEAIQAARERYLQRKRAQQG